MPKTKLIYLAVDIGASSGRVLAGKFDGNAFELAELHRFENGPVYAQGRMYWDILALWQAVQEGLRRASTEHRHQIRGVGVDTWGVDYGLLGPGDELLGNPRHYRDPRTKGLVEQTLNIVPRADVFAVTGLQFIEINTLYQLAAMTRENPRLLEVAEDLLMIPDLFHWLMTGVKTNEFTNATTTQCLNPATGQWAADLLAKLNIPTRLFRPTTPPGTNLGRLRSEVVDYTGLADVPVIVPGTHDTASAVMAVPARSLPAASPDWCYISSGTWSLMGVEVPRPIINEKCLELNFTNEGGVDNTVRLLKNIAGLWIMQECRRAWSLQGRDYSWEELTRLAAAAPPLVSLIDPDDASFTAPKEMPRAIAAYCQRTRQDVPDTDGAIVRCALESLALRYRAVLGALEELTGSRIGTIHIVGGGTRNRQLCQMTADACDRRVVAGPVEATAIGNAMLQAITAGQVQSISAAREIIGRSFAVEEYEPRAPAPWDDAFERFRRLGKS